MRGYSLHGVAHSLPGPHCRLLIDRARKATGKFIVNSRIGLSDSPHHEQTQGGDEAEQRDKKNSKPQRDLRFVCGPNDCNQKQEATEGRKKTGQDDEEQREPSQGQLA